MANCVSMMTEMLHLYKFTIWAIPAKTTGYSGTSPYGHLTSKKTSQLQSPWLSPKLYSTVQKTLCNKETTGYYYQKMKLVLGIIILFLQIIFFYMIMDTYKNYFNLP